MELLAVSRFDTPIGPLRAVCSEKGLAYLELPHQNGRGLGGWMKTHAPEARLIDGSASNDAVIEQVCAYLEHRRRVFSLDLDLRATPFQLAVYQRVAKIPYGETLAYSDIACAMGTPKAVRAVGAANGANPIPLVIPCHRVIGRGGALQGYAGGLDLKARLLAMEGAAPIGEPAQERLF
ncbi:MAG: methylated-DNA--[protein]-cysteine S-methyltransferase [Myxococcota bacterium]